MTQERRKYACDSKLTLISRRGGREQTPVYVGLTWFSFMSPGGMMTRRKWWAGPALTAVARRTRCPGNLKKFHMAVHRCGPDWPAHPFPRLFPALAWSRRDEFAHQALKHVRNNCSLQMEIGMPEPSHAHAAD